MPAKVVTIPTYMTVAGTIATAVSKSVVDDTTEEETNVKE